MNENKYRCNVWDEANNAFLVGQGFSVGVTDGLIRQNGVSGTIGGLTLLKSTGLSDRHGREGFEGDVFRITIGRHYWLYEIMSFNNYGGNLYAVCKEHNVSTNDDETLYTYEVITCKQIVRDCISKLKGGTIIGNRFEHPDLLGEGTPLSDALIEAGCL